MNFREQNIKGVFDIQLEPKADERGFFMRTYDKKIFAEHGLPTEWAQENHSFSKDQGTVRGLHFQYAPHPEAKLIRIVGGDGFFVFVDLRKGSPTLGKWGNVILSSEKKNMLFLPKGMAAGVCTLTPNCHLLYKMDEYYNPDSQGVLKWDDPDVAIEWPVKDPGNISEKDKNAPSFKEFLQKTGGGLEA